MIIAEPIPQRDTTFPSLVEGNAVGAVGQELKSETTKEIESTVTGSVFWAATVLFVKAQSKLSELSQLGSNWDTYGASPPNDIALENAMRVLGRMNAFDLTMTKIVPSAEGGVAFCFTRDDRYADIECSNEGDVLGVRYAGTQTPVLIETDGTDESVSNALEQVRNHIRA